MSDRLLKFSEAEFERAARRVVEKMFADNRTSPNPSPKIPIIDELLHGGPDYNPHGSAAEHAIFVELATRAVLARKWFQNEGPPWAQPLPLAVADCHACFNLGPGNHRRDALRGEYGLSLHGLAWRYERAEPFEIFCARRLAV